MGGQCWIKCNNASENMDHGRGKHIGWRITQRKSRKDKSELIRIEAGSECGNNAGRGEWVSSSQNMNTGRRRR